MRLLATCFILFFSLKSFASPIWTYDISGKINGPDHAGEYLRDISVGDEFWIRMFVQARDDGYAEDVGLVGRIGDWLFSYNNAFGFYYGGDWSPERWIGSTGYHFMPPEGRSGEINGAQLFVLLYGFDETGQAGWPEEDWLVKRSGWIDPSRFLRGAINLDFYASIDTGESVVWNEVILTGNITSFVQVSESNSLALFAIGLLGLASLRGSLGASRRRTSYSWW